MTTTSHDSILRYLRPGRRSGFALAASITAATVLPLAAPQFTGRFVDAAVHGSGSSRLMLLASGYLAAAIAGQTARMLTAWLASRLAWGGANRLRERLAGHVLGLDLGFHAAHTPGELIERVNGDVDAVSDFVVAFLLDVVASVLLLGGMLIVVCFVDPQLGGVLVVYYALAALAVGRAQRRAVPYQARARAVGALLMGQLEERLAAAEELRANGAGEHVVHRFWQASAASYDADLRASLVGSSLIAGTSAAFALGTAIVLGLAAWAQQTGRITVGTTVLLFQYTLMVRTPFERLFDQLRQYQAALAGVARIRELLAQRRELPEPVDPVPLPACGPLELRLDRVGFAYGGGEPVLSDLDITLRPGETLGIVGRTGSGKSTIAKLLLRLYDPAEGAVLVGGVDLRDADPGSVRRRIGIVTQDVQLFAASVRDNVTLLRPIADDETLRAILGEVGLGPWLAGLPQGLDTQLGGGDDGFAVGVSAGEAQLLAFARVFLTDPGLVVLDEASSRLDPATERAIERGIDRLLRGRTGVLIAHRLSALARVDKVAVIVDGRVAEYGPREELAADPGSRFARMLELSGARACGIGVPR